MFWILNLGKLFTRLVNIYVKFRIEKKSLPMRAVLVKINLIKSPILYWSWYIVCKAHMHVFCRATKYSRLYWSCLAQRCHSNAIRLCRCCSFDFCTVQNSITAIPGRKLAEPFCYRIPLSSMSNTCANYLEAPLANSLNILLSARFQTLRPHPRIKSARFSIAAAKAFPPHPRATAEINFPKTGVCDRDTHTRTQKPFSNKAAAPRALLMSNSPAKRSAHSPKGFCCWQMWHAQMSLRRQCQPANATRLLKVIKGCKSLSTRRTHVCLRWQWTPLTSLLTTLAVTAGLPKWNARAAATFWNRARAKIPHAFIFIFYYSRF